MMGLRLTKGLDKARWHEKFGADMAAFFNASRTARLIHEGYVAEDAESLSATAAGLQRLNAVLGYWLAA